MLCDDLECESVLRAISVTHQQPTTDDSPIGTDSSGQSTAARLRPSVSSIATVTPDRLIGGLGVRIARKRSPVTLSFLSPFVARPDDGLVDEPAVPFQSRPSLVQTGDRGDSRPSATPTDRPARTEQSDGLVPSVGIDATTRCHEFPARPQDDRGPTATDGQGSASRPAVREVTVGADSSRAIGRRSLERSGSTGERRSRQRELRSRRFVTRSMGARDRAAEPVALAMERRRSTALSEPTTASGRCSSAGTSLERGTLSLFAPVQSASQGLSAAMTTGRLDRSAREPDSSPSPLIRTVPASRVVGRSDTASGFPQPRTGLRTGGTNPGVRLERDEPQRSAGEPHDKERDPRAVPDLSTAIAGGHTGGVTRAGVTHRRDRVEYQPMRSSDRATRNRPRPRRHERIRAAIDPDLVSADPNVARAGRVDGSRVRAHVRSTTRDRLDPAHGRVQASDAGPAESADSVSMTPERSRADADSARAEIPRSDSPLLCQSVPVTTGADRIRRQFPAKLTAPTPHTERVTTTRARRTTTPHLTSQPPMRLWLPHRGFESHGFSDHSQPSVATSWGREQSDLTVQVTSPTASPSRTPDDGSSSSTSVVVPSDRVEQNTAVTGSTVSGTRRDLENTRRPGTDLSRSRAERVSPGRVPHSHGSSAMRSTRVRPITRFGSPRTVEATHSNVAAAEAQRAVAARRSGRCQTATGAVTNSRRRHASVLGPESEPAFGFRGLDGSEPGDFHWNSATTSAQSDRSDPTELGSAYRVSIGTPDPRRAALTDRSAAVRPQPRLSASSHVSRHDHVLARDSRNGRESGGNARAFARPIAATGGERTSSSTRRERASETHALADDVRPRVSRTKPLSEVAPGSVASLQGDLIRQTAIRQRSRPRGRRSRRPHQRDQSLRRSDRQYGSIAKVSPATAAVARGTPSDRGVRVDDHSGNPFERTPVPVSSLTTAVSMPRASADPLQTVRSGPLAVTNRHRHRSAVARPRPHTDRGRSDSGGRQVPFRERTSAESSTERATDRSGRTARAPAAPLLRPLAASIPVRSLSVRPSAQLWSVESVGLGKSFSPRNRFSAPTGIGAGSAEWSEQRDDAVRSPAEVTARVQQPPRPMPLVARPGRPSVQIDTSRAEPASSSASFSDSSRRHTVTTPDEIDGRASTGDSRFATPISTLTSIRSLPPNGAALESRWRRSHNRVRRRSSTVLSAVAQSGSLDRTALRRRSTDTQSFALHTRDVAFQSPVPTLDSSSLEQPPTRTHRQTNKIKSSRSRRKMEYTGGTEMEPNATAGDPSLTYRTASSPEPPTDGSREPRTRRSGRGRRQEQQRRQEPGDEPPERASNRRDRTQPVPRSEPEAVSESTLHEPSADPGGGQPALNDRPRSPVEHGTRRSGPSGSVPDSDRHRGDRFDDIDVPSDTDPRFDADVDRAVAELYRRLERKIRIERDRRGL